jgi:diguanylate cyclase (GGDEF)-like protein
MRRRGRAAGGAHDAQIADLLPIGVLLLDATGDALLANRAWVDLTGQREDTWCGLGWLRVLPEELRRRRLDEILAECERGSVYSAEWVIDISGSSTRVWHVLAKPDLHGDALARVLVSAVDVTGERAHTAELAFWATHDALTGVYNRAQFAVFVQHALDRRRRDGTRVAVLFLDVDDLKATNDAYGHEAGDRVLQTIASRLCAAVRPGDVVARYGGDEFAILCEGLGDDREALTIAERVSTAVLEPYEGEGTCTVSVGAAAADGHLLVGDLVRDADRAMYQAKHGRLPSGRPDGLDASTQLAIAAHELRTPLTAIVGSASTLERWRDDLAPGELDAAVSMIVRQSTRLAGIVDDLLDLGRVSHQTGPIEPVDVVAVVESAREAAPAPGSTSIAVRGLTEPSRLLALAHEPSLVRAVVNLLTNAYRHGGSAVVVTLRRDGEQVAIDVEDDGPGVPSELVTTLFDLFTRGDLSQRGDDWKGSGLGLAVARHAVEAVGGDLRYAPVEPHGARFTLVLPAAAPDQTDGGVADP